MIQQRVKRRPKRGFLEVQRQLGIAGLLAETLAEVDNSVARLLLQVRQRGGQRKFSVQRHPRRLRSRFRHGRLQRFADPLQPDLDLGRRIAARHRQQIQGRRSEFDQAAFGRLASCPLGVIQLPDQTPHL